MTWSEYSREYEKLTKAIQDALAAHLGKGAAKRLVSAGESAALNTLKALDPAKGRELAKALDALAAQARNVALDTATEYARQALQARERYEKTLSKLNARFSSKGDKVSIALMGNTYTFVIKAGGRLELIPKTPRGAKGPRRRK